MALSPPSVARQPLHRRVVQVEAFRRDDGLFDLEARLTDTKPFAIDLLSGRREAGDPVHDMILRVTIDAQFTIVHAEADPIRVPNTGVCEAVAPKYERLVGLNLLRGFRKQVQARLGRLEGCTHLSELTSVLPTAALQSISHLVRPIDAPPRTAPEPGTHAEPASQSTSACAAAPAPPSEPPFFIDQCHAYDRSGEVVRRHYPQWFVQADRTESP